MLAPLDVVCVSIAVALPLEFLPSLPGALLYATPIQCFEIFCEIGALFLAVGLALALVCVVAGLLFSLLLRTAPTRVTSTVCRGVSAVVMAVALVHALKTWLLSLGFQPALQASLVRWGFVTSLWVVERAAWWLLVVAVLLLALFLVRSSGRRPRSMDWQSRLRFIASGVAAAIAVGLVMQWHWPLNDRRATERLAEPAKPSARGRPDIVIVTIDTFSAQHASIYGYERPTTPALAALGHTASVFEHFYANSNFTTAGVASLLFGERPWTHRVFHAPGTPDESHARDSFLAVFHQAGYRTMAISTNGWASPPKLQVMPALDDYAVSLPWAVTCPWDINASIGPLMSLQSAAILDQVSYWRAVRNGLLQLALRSGRCPPSGHYDSGPAFETAKAMLKRSPAGQPTLLWVHVTPPHDPYAPPSPYVGLFDSGPQARRMNDSSPVYHYMTPVDALEQRKRLMGRYDEAIRYVDDSVGAFVQWLRAEGRFDRSAIVVSADHGESFNHDYGGHGGPELFDEVIRVPLIIKSPGQTTPIRISSLAEQADLLPTLAELAGIAPRRQPEGRSLMPLLQGGDDAHPPVYSMNFELQAPDAALQRGTVAMVELPWKLHLVIGTPSAATPMPRRERLYRLDSDPGERLDVGQSHPEVVARMRASVEARLAMHRTPVP